MLFFVSQPGGFPIGVAEGACLDCLPGRWPSDAKGRVAGAATAGRGGTALGFFFFGGSGRAYDRNHGIYHNIVTVL